MVTMPLLLLSGISPLQALATNKLQACVGSFTSAAHYYHSGLVDFGQSRVLIVIAVVFASLGAFSVQFIALDLLAKALPFVMIGLGIYFLLSPKISEQDRADCISKPSLYASCALASVYGVFLTWGAGIVDSRDYDVCGADDWRESWGETCYQARGQDYPPSGDCAVLCYLYPAAYQRVFLKPLEI